MKTINIFGSTGMIGTKSLKIIKDYFPDIKINILVAKKNYKKLAKQAIVYKPEYICLIDKSKQKNLEEELNKSKVKVLIDTELFVYLKEIKSDLTILSISGYTSLHYIQSIIINTKILGIVSKECIIAGGNLIKKLCLLHKTKLYALDSEHFSIQNFFDKKINIEPDYIKNIYLTASGGPFLNKNYKDINSASFKDAIKHPKWKMGVKNSIDSANLVNKCLEIIEAHYLFNIKYEKLKILIHPESLIHSILEFTDYTSNLNYFYHDMFIPIFNFFKISCKSTLKKYPNDNFNLKRNLSLNFYKPNNLNYPILKIFEQMDKYQHKNIINFNSGNELAVKLFSEGKINFGDINKIIEKSLSVDLKIELNSINNIIMYQNEFIKILKSKIAV